MRRVIALTSFLILMVASVTTAAEKLRIVTYNTYWLTYSTDENTMDQWGEGDDYALDEHYERVASLIETLDPDIINLTEVTTKEAVDFLVDILQAKGITQYKGYHVQGRDSGTGQDIALISRLTPDTIGNKKLRLFYSTGQGSDYRADYQWSSSGGVVRHGHTSITKNGVCCFTIGTHKIGLLALHLISKRGGTKAHKQREAQAKVAQKIIREEIVGRGYTPIVLGDMNDEDGDVEDREDTDPDSEALKHLKDYDSQTPGPELRNAAEKIGRPYDRYTYHYDENHNGKLDESDPMTMIDHILIHNDLWPSVKRVYIDHSQGRGMSDHWPVVVDLELN